MIPEIMATAEQKMKATIEHVKDELVQLGPVGRDRVPHEHHLDLDGEGMGGGRRDAAGSRRC